MDRNVRQQDREMPVPYSISFRKPQLRCIRRFRGLMNDFLGVHYKITYFWQRMLQSAGMGWTPAWMSPGCRRGVLAAG